jgi:hypothetical protein
MTTDCDFFGPNLVYAKEYWSRMNNFLECNCDISIRERPKLSRFASLRPVINRSSEVV